MFRRLSPCPFSCLSLPRRIRSGEGGVENANGGCRRGGFQSGFQGGSIVVEDGFGVETAVVGDIVGDLNSERIHGRGWSA